MNFSQIGTAHGLHELAELVNNPKEAIGLFTFASYVHNRKISPEVSPEQWEKIYGPTTLAMEAKYQANLFLADIESHTPELKTIGSIKANLIYAGELKPTPYLPAESLCATCGEPIEIDCEDGEDGREFWACHNDSCASYMKAVSDGE